MWMRHGDKYKEHALFLFAAYMALAERWFNAEEVEAKKKEKQ
jgi:hypothetical protein